MKKVLAYISKGMAFTVALAFSASAQDATFPYIDLKADVSAINSPITLGESVTLNGCGSKIHSAQGTPQYGLCESDMVNIGSMTLTWAAKLVTPSTDVNAVGDPDNSWTVIQSYQGGTPKTVLENLSASTGAGSAFTTAGTYIIGLWVKMADSIFTVPQDHNGVFQTDGVTQMQLPWRDSIGTSYSQWQVGLCIDPVPGSHCGRVIRFAADDGDLRTDGTSNYSYSKTFLTINPAAVSEPLAALMLLPCFALIARRERRRKLQMTSAA